MRLWHIDLINVLPRQQLLGQWRELNSIFKKQDKHILINYIYDYDKQYLFDYSITVATEMMTRNYRVNFINFNNYFKKEYEYKATRFKEHNQEYLDICYYNLKEKYLRGGITEEEWQKIDEKYKRLIKEEL